MRGEREEHGCRHRRRTWRAAVLGLAATLGACASWFADDEIAPVPAGEDLFPASAAGDPPADTGSDARAAYAYVEGVAHLTAGRPGLAARVLARTGPGEAGGPGRTGVRVSGTVLDALGVAYDRIGRHDLAARAYGAALVRDPGRPATLNNLGYSYLLRDRPDLAAAFLRDAGRRAPGDPVIFNNRRLAEEALARAGGPPVRITVAPPPGLSRAVSASARQPRIERGGRGSYYLVTRPPGAQVQVSDRRPARALPLPSSALSLNYLSAPMGAPGSLAPRMPAVRLEGGSGGYPTHVAVPTSLTGWHHPPMPGSDP